VPDVKEVIDHVSSLFTDPEEQAILEEAIENTTSPADRYQKAMQCVLDCRGPEEMNRVVRRAVLQARLTPLVTRELLDADACKNLEADLDGWSLPPAVEALGQLIAAHPQTFQRPTLTTNFDPLIEIATKRAGGQSGTIFLSADGRFDNVYGPNFSRVVHLHGYWSGADMLHTPQQLTRDRPRLKGCLRDLFCDTTLVVMGYGGWDDVITGTLFEAVAEGSERLDVLWCFYPDSEATICRDNAALLKSIEHLAGQRIVLYKGIDCHAVLPELVKRTSSRMTGSIPIPVSSDSNDRAASIRPNVNRLPRQMFGCDPPPVVDVWVGREKELSALRAPAVKVVTITAIGGQGKSALAAQFIKESEKTPSPEFELWDWRDCREQGDQIHTKLLSIIERLTQGGVPAAQLAGESVDSVVQTLFAHLGYRRILFVFDNIDHYVDLENAYPVLGMKSLFDAALTANHRSMFIFACRPVIHVESRVAVNIALGGFSLGECEKLFDRHGADLSRPRMRELIAEAFELAAGHTLWLSLIAQHVARKPDAAAELLLRIRRRRDAGLPDETLCSIWDRLDEKQKVVLRTMAETVRPAMEDQVSSFVPNSIHFPELRKILKALKALGLLVVTRLEDGNTGAPVDGYHLHPLVRQFIRETSSQVQRKSVIQPIILFYDKMIDRFKLHLPRASTLQILEHWIAKVELQINSGAHEQALATLKDVQGALLVSGYYEEFVRVASRLFDEMDWKDAMERDVTVFDDAFDALITCMVDLGRVDEVDGYLDRYGAISAKSASYVGYCGLRCYAYWFRGDHKSAIDWGARGQTLKIATSVDTDHGCHQYLALAERDGGMVDSALVRFLAGVPLERVVAPELLPNRSAAYYGNIGRCLWFNSDLDRAVICYKRSAVLLEKEEGAKTIINQGYARAWIAEVLVARREFDLAYYFMRTAASRWKKVAPPRALDIERKIVELREKLQPFEAFAGMSDDEIERRCRRWLYS
jgi:hypothetical protein